MNGKIQNQQGKSAKDFKLMIVGQIISILGSALLRFALSLHVLDVTGSEAIFATLFALSNVPLLLAPFGGAVADRFNRRNLMVIFDFTSSFIVFCLVLLMQTGNGTIAVIGTVMVLLSVVSAFYTPAVTASIPLLVEEKNLEGANGIVQAVQALSAVAAPVLGGILYGIFGVQTLIIISGIAFFLSAVMEIFIQIPFTKRAQEGHMIPVIMEDLKEGFQYVVKVPFILKSMILAALLNLLLTPYFVVGGSIIFRVTMESSDTMYGIGMGLINGATILGALSIGVFARKIQMNTLYRWILLIALLCLPLSVSLTPLFLGLGYYPSFVLFIMSAVPVAMIMTVISIFVIAKVQKKTANENLGKVMAIITAVSQCAAPIGQIIYGLVFKTFGKNVYLPTLFVGIAMLFLAVFTQKILKHEVEPQNA